MDKVSSIELSASGAKLLEDEKHEVSEVTINDYAYQLNLTVRHLDQSDFGTYTCSAENAFGKAEGSIRLQGTACRRSLRTFPCLCHKLLSISFNSLRHFDIVYVSQASIEQI